MGAMRSPVRQEMIDRQKEKQREQWFTDTGNRLTSMQKQLDELSAFQKQRQKIQSMPYQSFGGRTKATLGQESAGANLRIGQTGMAPSARRRMRRAG